MIFYDYSSFFKFHDFSMHGFLCVIFQVFHDFQSLWEPLFLNVCYLGASEVNVNAAKSETNMICYNVHARAWWK